MRLCLPTCSSHNFAGQPLLRPLWETGIYRGMIFRRPQAPPSKGAWRLPEPKVSVAILGCGSMDLQVAVERFCHLKRSTVPLSAFPRIQFSREGLRQLLLGVLCSALSQREAAQARPATATNNAGESQVAINPSSKTAGLGWAIFDCENSLTCW